MPSRLREEPCIYTRDLVETLIPAIWDEAYTYGMPRAETAPDPDMPKSWRNKKEGNTHFALIADIKTAWAKTELTLKERRSVFMHHVLDYHQREIAAIEGCTQPAISVRLFTAVGKLVACLNGGEFDEAAYDNNENGDTTTSD